MSVRAAAGLAILAKPVKVNGIRARVIERCVRNHANAAPSSRLCEAREIGVATKSRVDLGVVCGVVFVIAGRLEHRCDVQRIGPQRGDVIQLVDDACNITTKKVVVVDGI